MRLRQSKKYERMLGTHAVAARIVQKHTDLYVKLIPRVEHACPLQHELNFMCLQNFFGFRHPRVAPPLGMKDDYHVIRRNAGVGVMLKEVWKQRQVHFDAHCCNQPDLRWKCARARGGMGSSALCV